MGHGHRVLAAVDLGAESGRVVAGHLNDRGVSLELVHRFENQPVRLHDGLHWNLTGIFAEVLAGLAQAVDLAGRLDGIGIDSWGVDYGLLDNAGRLLGLPYHYRDDRVTAEVISATHARVPREELYSRTGIQTMPINTVYQLMSEPNTGARSAAARIALIPDLLGLWLTGELVNESTVASTTGLLEAGTGRWARDLIARLGLPERPFEGELCEPGRLLGHTPPERTGGLGAIGGVPVWTVASHDTAAAFVAAPIQTRNCAVISSGTWSLVGVELDEPELGPDAFAFNFTNERGLDGTVRLLRNVMGLWLLQECRREWRASGKSYDYDALNRLARASDHDVPVFDPDDDSLLRPGRLPEQIALLCSANGQRAPEVPGEMTRSILVSLACKYRVVLDRLRTTTGRRIDRVHVVGGGARNELLCQLTADIGGLPVLAGPVEATALGNVLVQGRAVGDLGALSEMRDLAARSVQITAYEPHGDRGEETYQRFLDTTGLASGPPAPAAASEVH